MKTIQDIDLFEVANRHFEPKKSGNIILQEVIKEMVEETPAHPSAVYLFISSDGDKEVYASKEDARKRLKEVVEKHFDAKWENLGAIIKWPTGGPDYVSSQNGPEVHFWQVLERKVM